MIKIEIDSVESLVVPKNGLLILRTKAESFDEEDLEVIQRLIHSVTKNREKPLALATGRDSDLSFRRQDISA